MGDKDLFCEKQTFLHTTMICFLYTPLHLSLINTYVVFNIKVIKIVNQTILYMLFN